MASRMDRHNYTDDTGKRTAKNSSLYDEIYEQREYTNSDVKDCNVDTLLTTSSHQIDIAEVKALLEKRESLAKNRQIVKEQPTIVKENKVYEDEDKNYDIRDVLSKAKEDHKEEYRPRSLADTQVLTLQELVTKKKYSNKRKLDEDEVKDLVDTIYQNNLLEDGGLLDDLKSTGNTVVDSDIKEILSEKKKEMEKNDEVEGIDKTFYTSSLGFKKSDFEDEFNDVEETSVGGKIATIFLIIACSIFVILIIYIIINYVL